jgi:hypothetical protein
VSPAHHLEIKLVAPPESCCGGAVFAFVVWGEELCGHPNALAKGSCLDPVRPPGPLMEAAVTTAL